MAEMETEEELTNESSEETNENETENDSSTDEISYEQALEWKKEAEELRALKAKQDAKIVEQKRALKAKGKQEQNPETIASKDEVRRILAEEKFYDKNPEAEAYRSKIEAFQEKGLSLEDSYMLASKSDREVESNREVYGKSIVKGSQSSSDSVKAVTGDEYDHMTEAQQNKYNSDMIKKHGTIKFKE